MKGKKGFQKGKQNPSFGKKPHNFGCHPSKETLKKQSESHLGKKLLEETKKKISLANKGKKKPPRTKEHCQKISVNNRGKNSHWWIDGRAREKNKYPKNWRNSLKNSIRERDNYKCNLCGARQGELGFGQVKRLDVHHIDYNKKNLNPVNLISLCRSCHVKTNYNRKYWINYFKNYETV